MWILSCLCSIIHNNVHRRQCFMLKTCLISHLTCRLFVINQRAKRENRQVPMKNELNDRDYLLYKSRIIRIKISVKENPSFSHLCSPNYHVDKVNCIIDHLWSAELFILLIALYQFKHRLYVDDGFVNDFIWDIIVTRANKSRFSWREYSMRAQVNRIGLQKVEDCTKFNHFTTRNFWK